MGAKDYSIMHCKDGNLYINRKRWTEFLSDDSKRFSNEDLESIESWIKQNNKYVLKDAFIEKAAKWVKERAELFLLKTPMCDYYDYKKAVKDFENYMEGE